ncbi:MAG: cation transporter [Anaerolineae bacterium]|nr:cation transporter [Anaerolineae bacterium]
MAHTHTHNHGPADYGRAFAIGVALNLGFVALEFFYGTLSHSLALVADAGHNLSDVLALVLAWGASVLVRRRPTQTHTYGLRRTSILAALFNALLLLVAIGAIGWEAVRRLMNPGPVEGETVIWVALVGIVINTATALMFMRGREHDINIRGAFLHMAADAGVSLGVVLAGFAILATGWTWLDPVVSLAIVAVIFIGTWGLLKDSVNMALDAVPGGINLTEVKDYLGGLPGVAEVHDLHVWPMSTTETALTAHLVIPNHQAGDALLNTTATELHDRFGIEHTTLQIEIGDTEDCCPQAAVDTV